MSPRINIETLEDYTQYQKVHEGKSIRYHLALQDACEDLLRKHNFRTESKGKNQEVTLPSPNQISQKQFENWIREQVVEGDSGLDAFHSLENEKQETVSSDIRPDVIGIRDKETIGCEINRPNSGTSPEEDAKRLMKFPFTYRFLILEKSNQYTKRLDDFGEVTVATIKDFHEKLEEELVNQKGD